MRVRILLPGHGDLVQEVSTVEDLEKLWEDYSHSHHLVALTAKGAVVVNPREELERMWEASVGGFLMVPRIAGGAPSCPLPADAPAEESRRHGGSTNYVKANYIFRRSPESGKVSLFHRFGEEEHLAGQFHPDCPLCRYTIPEIEGVVEIPEDVRPATDVELLSSTLVQEDERYNLLIEARAYKLLLSFIRQHFGISTLTRFLGAGAFFFDGYTSGGERVLYRVIWRKRSPVKRFRLLEDGQVELANICVVQGSVKGLPMGDFLLSILISLSTPGLAPIYGVFDKEVQPLSEQHPFVRKFFLSGGTK